MRTLRRRRVVTRLGVVVGFTERIGVVRPVSQSGGAPLVFVSGLPTDGRAWGCILFRRLGHANAEDHR